ncbi:MAG: DUF1858 domain-containing protein [Magnetococcales bacterium]|nr:DUF1858 domain-containing protein [Magnetococcales bacterium]
MERVIDVNKKMAQLMREHAGLAEFLALRGIDCGECLASEVDTLVDVARMYALDLEEMLEAFRASAEGRE